MGPDLAAPPIQLREGAAGAKLHAAARPARGRRAPSRARARTGAGIAVVVLAGEWVPAWLAMSITFLVALVGVAVLGWWVLRGDARKRKSEEIRRARPHDLPHFMSSGKS